MEANSIMKIRNKTVAKMVAKKNGGKKMAAPD
jgi:hypothetical protein